MFDFRFVKPRFDTLSNPLAPSPPQYLLFDPFHPEKVVIFIPFNPYKANGDPSVLNCPQTDSEDGHLILRREVEAAVQSLKKGKSAGVDNIQAELVQAGGEDVITALTTICNKIWQTGNGQLHGPSR